MERPPKPPASKPLGNSRGIAFRNRTRRANANRATQTRRAARNMIVRLADQSARTNKAFKERFPTQKAYLLFLGTLAAKYLSDNAPNNVFRNFPFNLNSSNENTTSNEIKDGFIKYLIKFVENYNADDMTKNNFIKNLRAIGIGPMEK
jgi:hypothetical protein